MKKYFFVIILFLFSVLGKCFSQSDSLVLLKEITVVSEKPLIQTGANIVKIDSIIISQKHTNNISSLLQDGSDIFIKTSGKGASATITLRGMTASHTTVLWNNIPFNSPVLGSADLSQIPVAVSDEINVIYGSSSANFNKNALSGILDLRSQPEWNEGFRFKYATEIASFCSFDNSMTVKFGKKKFQSATKIFENYSKNNFKFFNTDISNPVVERRKNADYLRYGIEQELYYKLNSYNIFSAKLWFQKSNRGVPGLTTNESGYNNHINRDKNDMFIYNVDYQGVFGNFVLSAFHGGNILFSNYTSQNQVTDIIILDLINSESKSLSLYNNISIKYKLLEKTELTLKFDYNFSKIKSIEKIRRQGYDTTRHQLCMLFSVFSEPFRNFRIGAILKQDYSDNKFSPFLPMCFLEYKILKGLSIKSSLSRNYTQPLLSDLYYKPGGNPNLKAETAYIVDAGILYFYNAKKWEIKAEIDANYNNISNWIIWKPTAMGYWIPSNLEKVESYGTSLSLNSKVLLKNFLFNISTLYSYTISQNNSTTTNINDLSLGRQLPYIPIHSANIRFLAEYKNFWLCYKWNFFSERYTDSAAEISILSTLPKYYMNAIAIGKNFYLKNIKISIDFTIDNLFNEKYYSLLWQPMPGINFSGHLTIQYK